MLLVLVFTALVPPLPRPGPAKQGTRHGLNASPQRSSGLPSAPALAARACPRDESNAGQATAAEAGSPAGRTWTCARACWTSACPLTWAGRGRGRGPPSRRGRCAARGPCPCAAPCGARHSRGRSRPSFPAAFLGTRTWPRTGQRVSSRHGRPARARAGPGRTHQSRPSPWLSTTAAQQVCCSVAPATRLVLLFYVPHSSPHGLGKTGRCPSSADLSRVGLRLPSKEARAAALLHPPCKLLWCGCCLVPGQRSPWCAPASSAQGCMEACTSRQPAGCPRLRLQVATLQMVCTIT